MSTSTKTGTCRRIATFGSRIPQFSSNPPQPARTQIPTPDREPINLRQIGERVRIGEKEGTLRYIGNVHFAKGVWCGIELSTAVGKNDGLVNGVRYFTCASQHGLMTPLAKVAFLETNSDHHPNRDNASGPYSILCIEPKPPESPKPQLQYQNEDRGPGKENQIKRKRVFDGNNKTRVTATFYLGQKTSSGDNLSNADITEKARVIDKTKSTEDLRRAVFKEKIVRENTSYSFSISNDNLTYQIGIKSSNVSHKTLNGTYCLGQRTNSEDVDITEGDRRRTRVIVRTKSTDDLRRAVFKEKLIHENQLYDNLTYSIESKSSEISHNSIENLLESETNRTYSAEGLNILSQHNSTYTAFNSSLARRYTYVSTDQENSLIISKKRSNLTLADDTLTTEGNDSFASDKLSSYASINQSSENILNDSTVEVKRRRKSNPKCHLAGGSVSKPTSLPQLRGNYPLDGHSTPNKPKPIRGFSDRDDIFDRDDDGNKRDSLELEESLGILTPDQMVDFFQNSSECNPLLSSKLIKLEEKEADNQEIYKGAAEVLTALNIDTHADLKEQVQSPNLNNVTEYSFGILDVDQLQSSFAVLKSDTTMNLELPLDNSKNFTLTRCEQTPSPEELPLDTTPIVESEPKTEPTTSKSNTSNSFVTSITSITSLDNGYQGDGEMSRPASRGADNSPLTRRPYPRPQPRRPDPMTDSDFYTESDVDNHEDNQIKGDRRAQVIDGTLYGVDPQAAADIYVNNRENMDSSGIFTDIESGLRNEDEPENDQENDNENSNADRVDVSPSDSSRTISGNSQNNLQEILQKNVSSNEMNDSALDKTVKENTKKRMAPSPGVSSPSSLSSPRHHSIEESASKKYKMPKRDVASKVKAMMEPSQTPPSEKKTVKKPVNRWDAVMNKISKNEQNKTNLKEIKSKVFDNVNLKNSSSLSRLTETRKTNVRPVVNQNNKTRIRTRTAHNSTSLKKVTGGNVESSIHSSLSDLSASVILPKKNPGSAKKREPIQVTQVLTPNKLTTRNQQNLAENKKNAVSPSSSNEIKNKRNLFSPKEKIKQPTHIKESSKPTVKGGRTSPSVRPPVAQAPRSPVKKVPSQPRVAEALAVLVQHLVFNVEAFRVPQLKNEVDKYRREVEEIRLCKAVIEEEHARKSHEILELVDEHKRQLAELISEHEEELLREKEAVEKQLKLKHDEQLRIVRQELDKLQNSHEESLEILHEENDSIREQVDEKRLEIEKINHESMKLKQDYECKERKLKEEIEMTKQQRDKFKQELLKVLDHQDKMTALVDENKQLRDEINRLLSYGDDKDIGVQEVQSLRVVVELKQQEIADLRKSLGQTTQKLNTLVNAEERALALQARCEDLQHQLQRKNECEQNLIQENQRLQESFKEEINQKRRLSQYNEELQWKLRQNKEVFTKVIEQAEETAFNRSNMFSSSFNEKHSPAKSNLERTLSFRERSSRSVVSLDTPLRGRKVKTSLESEMEDLSPPQSPKVKGVVEKSDSVSYVLDLDESPDVVASRIVRRSFRNTTPPKNTPTKSPSNKRPRMRNPLSTSASSSSITSVNKDDVERPKSASTRNGNPDDDVFLWDNAQSSPINNYEVDKLLDSRVSSIPGLKSDDDLDEDHEVDLQLPALPSEMDKRNGVLTLPSPKHLAGDSNVSDSNSEDESTSSSQL
ncbi:toucan isoform X2 [Rhynchophorus ferrugineus]|uniref:toucan isoform X2 n=2 Tax=Rhynchophorus ferrugineus TaxID=354439 RepID=UPI003FCDE637